ncbi:hypothetical protein [Macrococcus psychrotolerans]|uniref:Replicative helicase inhibitor G39P N-terminal domain-containing protein n=1 Tax=Macrococcus psychrotolerans TaxID=3039389 RepID=A0AAU6RL70_9STAP
MNKEQAVKIVKRVNGLYIKSSLSKEAAKIWIETLLKYDYEFTNQKITDFYKVSKFAPHISDILPKVEVNQALIEYEKIQKDIEKNKEEPEDAAVLAEIERITAQLKEELQNE